MKKNEWQRLYGAQRRAIDKVVLAEFERSIAGEEKAAEEQRKRIAVAFGRIARDQRGQEIA